MGKKKTDEAKMDANNQVLLLGHDREERKNED